MEQFFFFLKRGKGVTLGEDKRKLLKTPISLIRGTKPCIHHV